jgi:hypothetical protein
LDAKETWVGMLDGLPFGETDADFFGPIFHSDFNVEFNAAVAEAQGQRRLP